MAATFDRGFALLIGVNENQVQRLALPTVANDVAELRKVLVHPARCGYPEDHVRVVDGTGATREAVLGGLAWLGGKVVATPGATAIVYFSGHGFQDETQPEKPFYLVPYDVTPEALRLRSLRAEDFAAAVRALAPERLLVVLDCCHAGGMDVKGGLPISAAAIPPVVLEPASGEAKGITAAEGTEMLGVLGRGAGRAVLSSSRGDQPSSLRRDGKMSIFTYHLIEALTGHARPQEGAREVLVSDVMSHVYRRVPRSAKDEWKREQEPQYQVTGNFPVALLLGGEGWTKDTTPPDPIAPLPALHVRGNVLAIGSLAANRSLVGTFGNVHTGMSVVLNGPATAVAPATSPVVAAPPERSPAAPPAAPVPAPESPPPAVDAAGVAEALRPALDALIAASAGEPGSEFRSLFELIAELQRGVLADVARIEALAAELSPSVPGIARQIERARALRPRSGGGGA